MAIHYEHTHTHQYLTRHKCTLTQIAFWFKWLLSRQLSCNTCDYFIVCQQNAVVVVAFVVMANIYNNDITKIMNKSAD